MLNKKPNGWELTTPSFVIKIEVVPFNQTRGMNLGDQTNYGSVVSFNSSYNNIETVLRVTDPALPNCERSLMEIITAHCKQLQLGTFFKVDARDRSGVDDLRYVASYLDQELRADVKEFTQIPIYVDGLSQRWDIYTPEKNQYTAYRKYCGSYFVTKVVRENDSFKHPLSDSTPDGNISKRKESIQYTTLTADRLKFDDVIKLFQ